MIGSGLRSFVENEAELITRYALDTYYRHFKLYRYTHSTSQPTECTTRELLVEEPLQPPPLVDGVDAD